VGASTGCRWALAQGHRPGRSSVRGSSFARMDSRRAFRLTYSQTWYGRSFRREAAFWVVNFQFHRHSGSVMVEMPGRVDRRFRPPKTSYFLFGPRGTGKTTLLSQLYPESVRIDLLDPATSRQLSAYPERLADIARAAPAGEPVVVDEVQRVPEVLPVVHALIESDGLRFVLTGSSARKLRRSGQDLLGGRAVNRTIHPFTPQEPGEP
jgi:hypothetical protein